jgi:cbb3-type cytochrome oxidase maturation protein
VQEKSKDTFVQINNQLMSVLILLIAFSILIAGGFLAAFIWSVKKGQFDDDYTPSVRILMEEMKRRITNLIYRKFKLKNK